MEYPEKWVNDLRHGAEMGEHWNDKAVSTETRTLKWYGSFDRTIGASTVLGSELYLTVSFVIRMQLYWKNLVALGKHQWWIKMHFPDIATTRNRDKIKKVMVSMVPCQQVWSQIIGNNHSTVMTVMHTAQLCLTCTDVIYAGILFPQQNLKLQLV